MFQNVHIKTNQKICLNYNYLLISLIVYDKIINFSQHLLQFSLERQTLLFVFLKPYRMLRFDTFKAKPILGADNNRDTHRIATIHRLPIRV